ncbi:MAG TPA: rRNA maturation RNase YbeY [Bryobacteraceae bacterium]|jgi:probable rRNA maturation factor
MSSDGSTLLFGAFPPKFRFSAEEKRILKSFLSLLCDRLASGCSVVCLIADNGTLQRLNLQFLDHDYPTDVLSFPSGAEEGALGELAISVERAEAQAQEFRHSRIDEIRILMLHGVLHLTGLDHERDQGEMARAERKWRAEFGLPLSLTERARVTQASACRAEVPWL